MVARICKNVLIAALSTIWIVPFIICMGFLLEYMGVQERILFDKEYPEGWSFSYVDVSKSALVVLAVLLLAVTFFWAFVAASKLWPIRDNK